MTSRLEGSNHPLRSIHHRLLRGLALRLKSDRNHRRMLTVAGFSCRGEDARGARCPTFRAILFPTPGTPVTEKADHTSQRREVTHTLRDVAGNLDMMRPPGGEEGKDPTHPALLR